VAVKRKKKVLYIPAETWLR